MLAWPHWLTLLVTNWGLGVSHLFNSRLFSYKGSGSRGVEIPTRGCSKKKNSLNYKLYIDTTMELWQEMEAPSWKEKLNWPTSGGRTANTRGRWRNMALRWLFLHLLSLYRPVLLVNRQVQQPRPKSSGKHGEPGQGWVSESHQLASSLDQQRCLGKMRQWISVVSQDQPLWLMGARV